MTFEDLSLANSMLKAIARQKYTEPTEIQAACIPAVIEGRDVLGCAQTGTGKTAAFAVPALNRLAEKPSKINGRGRKIRCLVVAPTRELAIQICESFRVYGQFCPVRQTVVFGGVNQTKQVRALNRGVDVLVATPGRLLDLMEQGHVELQKVETLILDEADRMLDMGFLPDLRRIVSKVPEQRQTLLFSATMPAPIRKLADEWLTDPVDIRIAPESTTADNIEQSVFRVNQKQKTRLLTAWLQNTSWARTLVFTRTKFTADRVAKALNKIGIPADSFHGSKSQNARQRVLQSFKSPKPRVLVATDIAARGLDIDNITHVVNYDMPVEPENYVHRIGRSARAGMTGVAVSFCSGEEVSILREVERLTREKLTVEPQPEGIPVPETASVVKSGEKKHHGGSNGGRRQRNRPGRKKEAGKDNSEQKQNAVGSSSESQRRSSNARNEKSESSGKARPNRKRRRPSAGANSSKPRNKKRRASR